MTSTAEPLIRPRADGDLDACVRALAEVHERDGYPVDWPERPGRWLTPDAALGCWVAELDGRVAGHVVLSRATPGDLAPARLEAPAAVLGRLFVDPAARGHGLGAALIAEAVGAAREHGLHPVLDVVASDTAAIALYERLGWTLLAEVDERWGPGRTVTVRCYAAPRSARKSRATAQVRSAASASWSARPGSV